MNPLYQDTDIRQTMPSHFAYLRKGINRMALPCDYSTYNTAVNETAQASQESKAACDALTSAQQAMIDAQANLDARTTEYNNALENFETKKRLENAEAKKLGIEPCPAVPPA